MLDMFSPKKEKSAEAGDVVAGISVVIREVDGEIHVSARARIPELNYLVTIISDKLKLYVDEAERPSPTAHSGGRHKR